MRFSDRDRAMMQRALEVARRGVGHVSPNPLVGCVIATAEGQILGEGAHLKFGEAHAEPNAIRDAESKGHSVEGGTVYVTLEPHSHQGKTPPCSTLLVEKRIGRCVVAMEDPYPLVSGNGLRELQRAGIAVECGLMEAEARELNRFFIRHVTSGLPYVTLKLGMSIDGRTALANGESRWITSEASRREVHWLRSEYDAVMVGSGTARADDPALTVRLTEGRQPWRVVIDSDATLPPTLKLFSDEYRDRTLVLIREGVSSGRVRELEQAGVRVESVTANGSKIHLESALRALAKRGIASVLAEAGPRLASALISGDHADELLLYAAPMILGGDAQPAVGALGLKTLELAPRYALHRCERVPDTDDVLIALRRRS